MHCPEGTSEWFSPAAISAWYLLARVALTFLDNWLSFACVAFALRSLLSEGRLHSRCSKRDFNCTTARATCCLWTYISSSRTIDLAVIGSPHSSKRNSMHLSKTTKLQYSNALSSLLCKAAGMKFVSLILALPSPKCLFIHFKLIQMRDPGHHMRCLHKAHHHGVHLFCIRFKIRSRQACASNHILFERRINHYLHLGTLSPHWCTKLYIVDSRMTFNFFLDIFSHSGQLFWSCNLPGSAALALGQVGLSLDFLM